MSKNPREPGHPRNAAKSDLDTATHPQPLGGDDSRSPRTVPRLPHERDESARATGDRLRETPVPSDRQISQAREDVGRGLVDTDRRGVPNDVPNRKTT